MTINIETRLTRPGDGLKPSLESKLFYYTLDFDVIGHDALSNGEWRALCKTMKISPNQNIAITEAGGTFCSPRLAWMLDRSGFKHVSLIKPTDIVQSQSSESDIFIESELDDLDVSGFVGIDAVFEAINNETQIVDVRSASRFSGDEPDPRPNVKAGHIPSSINIHYGEFLAKYGESVFKSHAELTSLFTKHRVDLSKPIIFSCGSGITACIGALAAVCCGAKNVEVYDGSWSEWGARSDLPVAVGHTS